LRKYDVIIFRRREGHRHQKLIVSPVFDMPAFHPMRRSRFEGTVQPIFHPHDSG